MSLKRFALAIAGLLVLQAAFFSYWYRDLLRLRQPVARLVADRGAFEATAARALSRTSLTDQHLFRLADGARALGDAITEQAALRRLLATHPGDVSLTLRLADSLRLSGHLEEAERLYSTVIADARPAGGAQ